VNPKAGPPGANFNGASPYFLAQRVKVLFSSMFAMGFLVFNFLKKTAGFTFWRN